MRVASSVLVPAALACCAIASLCATGGSAQRRTRARPCPSGMVRVAEGTFWMGSPYEVGDPDEHPRHEVTLSSYCLDRTEVTMRAYAECVGAGRCAAIPTTVAFAGYTEDEARELSAHCNATRDDRGDHPVNCVDWAMADAYCRFRGNRLPSEAEWELAARGTEGRLYPWGDAAPDHTRLNAAGREHGSTTPMYAGDDGFAQTAPVGSYPAGAGPYGHLDLAGNVWEWTADAFGAYDAMAARDPRPTAGRFRVVRGGGWANYRPGWVRGADRFGFPPDTRNSGMGFRCAR